MKLTKLFKSTELKKAEQNLKEINQLGKSVAKLTDEELRHKTTEFKERLLAGESLDELKNEAFAVVREATERVLKKRLFWCANFGRFNYPRRFGDWDENWGR
ncbi:hypothetical protein [Mycoplasma sp. ATU-Cv-508]|uniref:hypothetical protein n=1 Tax=Mycoplasma sp. ATU-Cv-508 TaxID=2048001 RepID=UPI000FDF3AD9